MDALYQGVDGLSNQVEHLVHHATVPDLNAQQLQLCQLLSALAEGRPLQNMSLRLRLLRLNLRLWLKLSW